MHNSFVLATGLSTFSSDFRAWLFLRTFELVKQIVDLLSLAHDAVREFGDVVFLR
jgi:hypothetical protein